MDTTTHPQVLRLLELQREIETRREEAETIVDAGLAVLAMFASDEEVEAKPTVRRGRKTNAEKALSARTQQLIDAARPQHHEAQLDAE
jgi:hypothetical protein